MLSLATRVCALIGQPYAAVVVQISRTGNGRPFFITLLRRFGAFPIPPVYARLEDQRLG
jgi:hypothetical protein